MAGPWLYAISARSGRRFEVKGARIRVTVPTFRELVNTGQLQHDEWWHVVRNYRHVRSGDEVFVYSGDGNAGIIGYARAGRVRRRQDGWRVQLRFDLAKCQALLDAPVPAMLVRSWVFPRGNLISLGPFQAQLQRHLPWRDGAEGGGGRGGQAVASAQGDTLAGRGGAGFGSVERNALVDQAAMDEATRHYRRLGWTVQDVSRPVGRNYDLHCTRPRGRELHVEVKGASGDTAAFLIGAGEHRRWGQDPGFVLCLVTRALTAPHVDEFPGAVSRDAFSFTTVGYMARLTAPSSWMSATVAARRSIIKKKR